MRESGVVASRQVVAVDLWQQGVIELLMAQQMEMEGSR